MKFVVQSGRAEPLNAEITKTKGAFEASGRATYVITLSDGKRYTVAATPVGAGTLELEFEGRLIRVPYFDAGAGKYELGHDLITTRVQAQDQREVHLAAKGSGSSEGQVIVKMPGKIVKVLVNEGDKVEQGQGVIIVEAMKMENELKAGKAGTVTKIRVKPGETVESGAILADIGD